VLFRLGPQSPLRVCFFHPWLHFVRLYSITRLLDSPIIYLLTYIYSCVVTWHLLHLLTYFLTHFLPYLLTIYRSVVTWHLHNLIPYLLTYVLTYLLTYCYFSLYGGHVTSTSFHLLTYFLLTFFLSYLLSIAMWSRYIYVIAFPINLLTYLPTYLLTAISHRVVVTWHGHSRVNNNNNTVHSDRIHNHDALLIYSSSTDRLARHAIFQFAGYRWAIVGLFCERQRGNISATLAWNIERH